ncbi:MAG: DUF3054 domain-containing protein [Anaerolineae bacterium]
MPQSESPDYHLRSTVALAVGDLVTLLLFAALGRSSHDRPPGAIPFAGVISTAAPFIVGWFSVGAVLGVFKQSAVSSVRSAFLRAEGIWLVAGPVGLLLRALFLRRSIPLSFAAVVMSVNFVLLGAWRTLYAWLRAHRR